MNTITKNRMLLSIIVLSLAGCSAEPAPPPEVPKLVPAIMIEANSTKLLNTQLRTSLDSKYVGQESVEDSNVVDLGGLQPARKLGIVCSSTMEMVRLLEDNAKNSYVVDKGLWVTVEEGDTVKNVSKGLPEWPKAEYWKPNGLTTSDSSQLWVVGENIASIATAGSTVGVATGVQCNLPPNQSKTWLFTAEPEITSDISYRMRTSRSLDAKYVSGSALHVLAKYAIRLMSTPSPEVDMLSRPQIKVAAAIVDEDVAALTEGTLNGPAETAKIGLKIADNVSKQPSAYLTKLVSEKNAASEVARVQPNASALVDQQKRIEALEQQLKALSSAKVPVVAPPSDVATKPTSKVVTAAEIERNISGN